MKKMKKLAALVLAMVMAFSLMAVTAAAYGAEEHKRDGTCCAEAVQPRKPGATCSYCGYGMTETGSSQDSYGRYLRFTCYNDDCSYFISSSRRERATTKVYL